MTRALQRHQTGTARVIPIILRPVDWEKAPFSELKALPTDGKPITGRGWHNTDEAFTDVARGIREAVETKLTEAKRIHTAGEDQVRQANTALQDVPAIRSVDTQQSHSSSQNSLAPFANEQNPLSAPQTLPVQAGNEAGIAQQVFLDGEEELHPIKSSQSSSSSRHLPRRFVVLILLTLLLLGGVGGGGLIYRVATGHFPWQASPGLSIPTSSANTVHPDVNVLGQLWHSGSLDNSGPRDAQRVNSKQPVKTATAG